ncbi:MAG: 3-oxoadipate enol-lactonase / 4-carboxymuconolactone decarboxylase [Acidimicrobiaceae bacterium]|nr:3-oxoadipate enol-lactonase / 4-carboxymuconolactone decarboxylase [Acidimicrobiaceae bacterium]
MTPPLPHHAVEGPAGAPVLVLSNSLGTDLHLWEPQMPILRERFRVVRYDHPGHGGTPASHGPLRLDDLAAGVIALLDHIDIATASFCGLSLGGMVGMALASGAPERIERLVLACTSAHLDPRGWWDRARTVRDEGTAAIAEAVVGRWFTPGFAEANPEVVERFRKMFLASDPSGYASCCEAIAAMDLEPRLAGIRAPTLVVGGAVDAATPPEHSEAIARRIAGSRLVMLADAAHLANVEQPSAFTDAVLDHLDPSAYDRGMRIRRQVLGDAHVDAAAARAAPFTADFQAFLTTYAWGEVWSRPGLDRRTRSCITVAMLVALGRDEELALHLRAARTNGVSVDEIKEVLLQSAIYCGVPAANHAFAVAAKVLDDKVLDDKVLDDRVLDDRVLDDERPA